MSEQRALSHRFLTLKEVLDRVGISRSLVYELVSSGAFPTQVKVGTRTVWVAAELDAWMADRMEKSRGGTHPARSAVLGSRPPTARR